MKKYLTILIFLLLSIASPIFANYDASLINKEDAPVQFFADYETGLVSVLSHKIKIGEPGNLFDYVSQGGQDILFPFERYNVGAVINERHRISFLYQPLEINTVVPFESTVTVDGKDFDGVTELKYGFPFWRVSYSYDLLEEKDVTFAVGFSLQIRNASIVFKDVSNDPAKENVVAVSQNVGPVPAIHIYSRWETPFGVDLSADITGLYASSALINGASFEFEGSILDASLRAGYELKNNVEIFGNVRFLGGTAKGSSSYSGTNWSVASNAGRYTENTLATFSATMGLTIR